MTVSTGQQGASGAAVGRLPILFLDVDGPLNPFAAKPTRRPAGYVTHRLRPAGWTEHSFYGRPRALRVWLNPDHGAALAGLPVELVWATTWEHDANRLIGPQIGLPRLPVVEWPSKERADADGLFWKTRHLAEYAAGRPFAWVDDQISPADWRWCAERYPAPSLLQPIDPRFGLREKDFAAIARWAALIG
ncbi:hypothetical protein KDL01_07550 [Actinospica durhamensis]|uniref:Secreted protein n=1 Tax=Actinospica durhamensis TaxID=1508375 RepID=A0A941IQN1_9ACTN|nr:hypothetical protein [Actinospica durhamensis]MBR7833113.1 hypothetical protein [Actinospica durhamensis]